jgi:hypothetical protein
VKPEAKLAFFRTFDIQFGSNLIFGIAIIQDISNVFSIMVGLSLNCRHLHVQRWLLRYYDVTWLACMSSFQSVWTIALCRLNNSIDILVSGLNWPMFDLITACWPQWHQSSINGHYARGSEVPSVCLRMKSQCWNAKYRPCSRRHAWKLNSQAVVNRSYFFSCLITLLFLCLEFENTRY